MLAHTIWVLHIIVVGYWLGADLVINSTFRHLCYSQDMAFSQRDRLMDHILNVDQHVRYALLLQLGLGFWLASQRGYLPDGMLPVITTAMVGGWLLLVEVTHRQRKSPLGLTLAKVDRGLRYLLLISLLLLGLGILSNTIVAPGWLGWKLLLFALVITSGVAIRFQVIKFYQCWQRLRSNPDSQEDNDVIKQVYINSRRILLFLWGCISLMVLLSVGKPI